jgi:TP901 family phage tail tape measure protein
MTDRQVRIIISADVANAIRGMRDVESGLGRVGRQGQDAGNQAGSFGQKLKDGLGAAGVTLGLAGVAAGIGYVIKQGVGFQDNMNSLRAVTGASAGEMDRLSARARSLGKDIDLPATSAGDAAEAMLELAKGGLSVNESMAAAKGTLLLAAAAQVSGAEAATIQANALNAFALSGDQANHVADVLANTANAASGEITDFAAGLQQSATVAHSFGIGIEDSATTLGLFAKAGISGSDAGTSFKTMLTALASPTKQQQIALDELNLTVYDAQGNFVGMKSITEQLAAAKGNLTQQEYNAAASTAFGSDAIRAANILAEGGVGAWNDMAAAVGKAGGAQELAAAKTQGVSGAFGKMMSAIEDVSLTLFNQFAPALEGGLNMAASLVGTIGDLVSWFGNLPAPIQAGATALAALILLKGPLAALWTSMMASGVGLAIQGEMLAAKLAMQSMRLEAAATGGSMTALGAGLRVAGIAAVGFGNSLKAAFMSNPIGLALVAGVTALTFFMSATDDAAGSTADFTGAIDENTGALNSNAPAVIASASAKSGAFAAYKAIGGSVKEYTDALLGNTTAQDALHTRLLDTAAAAVKGSNEWGRYVASGQSAGKSAREVASDILASGDAGQFASSGLDAAMNASRMYASESDILGTEAEQTNDVIAATAGAAGAAGSAAAGAAPNVAALGEALKVAADNAQFMADNTELSQSLSAVSDAASDASRALQYFKIAQEDADGRVRSLDEATANQNATLRALGEALKDGTAAATENAAAGDLNTEALNNWDVAALTATESGSKVFDEMQRMADQYAETTAAAYSNAAATGDLTGANNAGRAAATQSRAAFVSLMTQYNGGNTPAAELLADKLGILDGTKIDNKTFETINQDAIAQQKLREAKAAVIGDKNFSVNAQDNATYTINNIQAALNAMQTYKQITVATVYSTPAMTAFNANVREDGGVVHAAMGRVVAGRGQSMVADGRGPGLTWAEAATNKEYYLSMKDSMKDRNRGLASQAVTDLGGQAVWGSPSAAGMGSMSGAGTMSGGASQPINLVLTLLGDGPITEAALGAARVTVNGAMRDVRLLVNRAKGQS